MNKVEQTIYDWLRQKWCNDRIADHCYACERQAGDLAALLSAAEVRA